ncbi:serine/threonine-protein kinase [Nocardia sp. NPDC050710]|uniref:serine/threonine-protein kinase n=1 Tax=Nocardia sp. NPDC050710 TaxID=3157220 RepID=UPI0033FA4990
MGQTLAPGQTFAGYGIERLLGVGGMGEVYLAQDRDLPRMVALKLLSRAMTGDADIRRRFLHEAEIAARLSHPNIVTVYARGQEDDQLWMAMQYIDGTDVAEVLRNGPLHPEQAVRVVSETAKALDHAHNSGILHRDVKPANILLGRSGLEQVFLADFGIAKALDQVTNLTRTGELHASFQYAAPEQMDVNVEIDRRADVYALGCTLYHMLTGAYPYPGNTAAQLIHGHLNQPVPLPSHQIPSVPTAFDNVIAIALAKDRNYRFASCGELASAAEQALVGHRVAAPPTVRSKAPRRRGRQLLLAAVGLALVVGLAGAGAVVLTMRNSVSSAQTAEQRSEAARLAACNYMRVISTYDYRNLDQYERDVFSGATGDFKTDFQRSFSDLRTAMTSAQVRSRVGDLQCFMKTADADRPEVAVLGTQLRTNANSAGKEESIAVSVIMTMEKVGDHWLCSKVQSPQTK